MKSPSDRKMHAEMGARIRKCLEARYETQAELARTIGVSEPTMSNYLSGKIRIPYTQLVSISGHLGVGIPYLLGVAEKENDGDLRDTCNKRIDDGYELIWRFDPHEVGKLCGYLGDVMEGLFHLDTLHAACGVPIHMLSKWRGMIRAEGWKSVEEDIKKYLEELDKGNE